MLVVHFEGVAEIVIVHIGGDRVVGTEYVPGTARFHSLDNTFHLAADEFPVTRFEYADIQAAEECKAVTVPLREFQQVATGFYLHGVESVEPSLHNLRQRFRNASTGVQDHRKVIAVEEVHEFCVIGKDQGLQCVGRAEQALAIAEILVEPDTIGLSRRLDQNPVMLFVEIGVNTVVVVDPARPGSVSRDSYMDRSPILQRMSSQINRLP
jgi:hypothetical protein